LTVSLPLGGIARTGSARATNASTAANPADLKAGMFNTVRSLMSGSPRPLLPAVAVTIAGANIAP
jgi:hypothetical protein